MGHISSKDGQGVRIRSVTANFSAQNEEETKVDFGSGYLFDTNGMHAGCFRPSSERE